MGAGPYMVRRLGQGGVDENISVLTGIVINILCYHWLMLHIDCSGVKLMLLV